MFEIDIYTRTTANRPFAIQTIKANDRAEVMNVVREQTQILTKQYKNPKCNTVGTMMQFKTNRGNIYAEIEINKIQDK